MPDSASTTWSPQSTDCSITYTRPSGAQTRTSRLLHRRFLKRLSCPNQVADDLEAGLLNFKQRAFEIVDDERHDDSVGVIRDHPGVTMRRRIDLCKVKASGRQARDCVALVCMRNGQPENVAKEPGHPLHGGDFRAEGTLQGPSR